MNFILVIAALVLLYTISPVFATQENPVYAAKPHFPESVNIQENTKFSVKISNTENYFLSDITPIIEVNPKSANNFVHIQANPSLTALWGGYSNMVYGTIYVDKDIPVERIFVSVSFTAKNSRGEAVSLANPENNASIKIIKTSTITDASSIFDLEKNASSINMISALLYTPFEIKYNQTAIIPHEHVKVKFSKITDDSRCPSDVTCVWQGEIGISVDAQKGDADFGGIRLELGGDGNAEIPIFDKYFIRLLKVEPYPHSTHNIQSDEYVATLVIVKTNSEQVLSPLQQFKSGIPTDKITCKEGLELVIKTEHRHHPMCVTSSTKSKMIQIGLAQIIRIVE